MAQADNIHSRVVSWLKIILPLIALIIMSSIFLVSRKIDPTGALPYSDAELTDRAREPRLTAPIFSGMTSDGATILIDAQEIRPDSARLDRGKATNITARMETPDGVTTDLDASTGRVDMTNKTFELEGAVKITSSLGYVMTSPFVTGSISETLLDATGPVQIDAPMGRITADTMHIRPDPLLPKQYLLVFNGNVRLIYNPVN